MLKLSFLLFFNGCVLALTAAADTIRDVMGKPIVRVENPL
jgi:hypothetical protein